MHMKGAVWLGSESNKLVKPSGMWAVIAASSQSSEVEDIPDSL